MSHRISQTHRRELNERRAANRAYQASYPMLLKNSMNKPVYRPTMMALMVVVIFWVCLAGIAVLGAVFFG